jgi:hypothetical protein
MPETTDRLPLENALPETADRPRRAAAGKALIVYLATGSVGAALIAFLLFKGMGC